MRGLRVYVTIRYLAIIASIGFLIFGLLYIQDPRGFINYMNKIAPATFNPTDGYNYWISFTFSYMITITIISLFIAYNPAKYKGLLLILAMAKYTSSFTTFYYYFAEYSYIYLFNFVVDLLIAITSTLLYIIALKLL